MRHWRVRTKLTAAVLLPTLATVALAGTQIVSLTNQSRGYSRVAEIADLGSKITPLVAALQSERDLSSGWIGSGRALGVDDVTQQRGHTDDAVSDYRNSAQAIDSGYSDTLTDQLAIARAGLDGLDGLRAAVDDGRLTRASIFSEYSSTINALLNIDADIDAQGDDRALTDRVDSLNAISRAKEATSQVRGELFSTINTGAFAVGQFQSFVGIAQRATSSIDQFQGSGSAVDQELYANTVHGKDVATYETFIDSVSEDLNRFKDLNTGKIQPDAASDWYDAASAKVNLMGDVENDLLNQVIDRADFLRSGTQLGTLVVSLELLAVVIIAGLITFFAARSMTRPLRHLRSSALDVAGNRLPAVIERLRQPNDVNPAALHVEPTGIDTGDEIGEVAQAFDEVHREAVRLAADQAVLRQSVNSMFVNLSRRSQGLVERQLRLIDELESNEQNPDQLDSLFKLDHLATRMRRTDDSLLVLAGSETGRGWSQPMSLADVLLAAISEVEQYTRLARTTVTDVSLLGYAVSDVVHLLAELMENSTAFSPPETTVTVSCRNLAGRGGAMIEIEDHGIGMSAEELDTANERLAASSDIDVASVRTMGLFVVGRLAAKHGIRVQLRGSSTGTGLTALVLLPPVLLTQPRPENTRAGHGLESQVDSELARIPTGGNDPRRPRRPADPGVDGAPVAPDPTVSQQPSPIFDSVSEWFRHRRRIDHDAVASNDRAPATSLSMPASSHRPPAEPPPPVQPPPPAQPPPPVQPPPAPPRQSAPPEPPRPDSAELPRRAAGGTRPPGPPSPPPSAPPPSSTGPHRLPRRSGPGGPPAGHTGGNQALPERVPPREPAGPPVVDGGWTSPADEGWRAAEAAGKPAFERTTTSGLPIRRPRANLIPGSAGPRTPAAAPPPPPSGGGQRTPDAVRSLLSTYYSSYRRGRTDDVDPSGKHRAGGPESSGDREDS